MKKTLASLLLSCSALLTQAQDTYWALAGNKIFNTATNTVTNTTQSLPFFRFDDAFNAHFRSSGGLNPNPELIMLGHLDGGLILPFGSGTGNIAFRQVVPVPNVCNKYLAIYAIPNIKDHTLQVWEITTAGVTNNAAATAIAEYVGTKPTFSVNKIGPHHEGVTIAAPYNTDGSRHFYHLSSNGGAHYQLDQYYINANGNLNTTPTATYATLPPGHVIDMAADGQSVGYIADGENGQGVFTTIDLPTGNVTQYANFLFDNVDNTDPAIEFGYGGNGERRWFISNRAEAGYVEEGHTFSYTQIANINQSNKGLFSAFVLGKNNRIYFAWNTAGSSNNGPGDLYWFPAAINSGGATGQTIDFMSQPVLLTPGQAQISTTILKGGNHFYVFGNHVAGEDGSSPTYAMQPASFNLNGQGSTTNISTFYRCDGRPVLMSALSGGFVTSATITAQPLDWNHDHTLLVPKGDAEFFNWDMIGFYEPNELDLVTVPEFNFLEDYNGYFDMTLSVTGPCGIAQTIVQRYRIVQMKDMTVYKMVGPTPGNCTYRPREESFNIPQIGYQSTAPCLVGWLGAESAALVAPQNFTELASNVWITDLDDEFIEHRATVYKANTLTGLPSSPILGSQLSNLGRIQTIIDLTTVSADHFVTYYASEKDVQLYMVDVEFDTWSCGTVHEISYFRILDGGTPGATWKPSGDDGQTEETISSLQNEQATSLYPNPAKDKLHIAWHSAARQAVSIQLTDALGRTVLQQAVDAMAGNNNIVIDMARLAPGLYHYRIDEGGKISAGNIVKE